MKRSPLQRRSPLRARPRNHRRARVSRYQRRERNVRYMLFVKTLDCRALVTIPGHRCFGPTESDHAGRRGTGQKADDTTCIPLCQQAHRHRHDFAGPFRSWSQARMRRWLEEAIVATQLSAIAAGVWAGPALALEAAG